MAVPDLREKFLLLIHENEELKANIEEKDNKIREMSQKLKRNSMGSIMKSMESTGFAES